MSAKVVKTPLAKIDLAELTEFIAANNVDAALRFLDAAERDCCFLAGRPAAGVRRNFSRKELAGLRSWPISGFSNYLIFYRPAAGGVEIIRVLHGVRDFNAIFKR